MTKSASAPAMANKLLAMMKRKMRSIPLNDRGGRKFPYKRSGPYRKARPCKREAVRRWQAAPSLARW